MATFSHIINPVGVTENPELYKIQQVSFDSICMAIEYAKELDIKIYTTFLKNNTSESLPINFMRLSSLQRDTSNITNSKKNHPILSDILKIALAECKSDYIIFTNIDIALMPYFYKTINHYVLNKTDAIVINRRRIHNHFANESNLNIMYAESGLSHLGYDCFVIKKTILEKFIFKDIALGVPPSGGDVFYNIMAFAENPVLLTQKHLTFHIGMELVKKWGDNEIRKHNQAEFISLLKELKPKLNASKFPGANFGLFKRHFKWLMNPTLHYPTMFMLDLKRGFRPFFSNKRKPEYARNSFFEFMVNRINFDED